jgi:hypothetical protein
LLIYGAVLASPFTYPVRQVAMSPTPRQSTSDGPAAAAELEESWSAADADPALPTLLPDDAAVDWANAGVESTESPIPIAKIADMAASNAIIFFMVTTV